jgi:hypothetical protein
MRKSLNVLMWILGIILIVELTILAFLKITLIQPQLNYIIYSFKLRDMVYSYFYSKFHPEKMSEYDELQNAVLQFVKVKVELQ